MKRFIQAFHSFKEPKYYQESQAKQILSDIEQYYIGKRRARDLRSATNNCHSSNLDILESSDDDNNTVMSFDISKYEPEDTELSTGKVSEFTAKTNKNFIQRILEHTIENINLRSYSTKNFSTDDIKRVVRHTLPKKTGPSNHLYGDIFSIENQGTFSPKAILKNLEKIVGKPEYACTISNSNSINLEAETIVRLLDDAIKDRRCHENCNPSSIFERNEDQEMNYERFSTPGI